MAHVILSNKCWENWEKLVWGKPYFTQNGGHKQQYLIVSNPLVLHQAPSKWPRLGKKEQPTLFLCRANYGCLWVLIKGGGSSLRPYVTGVMTRPDLLLPIPSGGFFRSQVTPHLGVPGYQSFVVGLVHHQLHPRPISPRDLARKSGAYSKLWQVFDAKKWNHDVSDNRMPFHVPSICSNKTIFNILRSAINNGHHLNGMFIIYGSFSS